MFYNKEFAEIQSRKKEIRNVLESDEKLSMEKLEEIETELRSLDDKEKELERKEKLMEMSGPGRIIEENPLKEERMMKPEDIFNSPEYRSAYLKTLLKKDLTDIEKRALTTAGTSAGAAVPKQTLNMIVDKLRQTSALFNYVSVSYVPGNLSAVVANAKNSASWKTEGSNGTPADDTVTEVSLTGYELIKLVEISAAAYAMTIDAFESYISSEIGRQMAIAIENAILNGTGLNQPTGILGGITWNATNSATWATGTTVGYDDLMNALSLLPTMYHPTAAFVMNRSMLFGGVRKISDSAGMPLFVYNPQDAVKNAILGYPVIVDDYMPDDTILLGDFSYYYLNFSQSPTIEFSREAAFSSGKVVYRGLAVADGKPALSEAFVKISEA